jgi:hypothetical protein
VCTARERYNLLFEHLQVIRCGTVSAICHPFGPNQPPKHEPSAAHHAVAAAAAAAAANQSTPPPIALSRESTLAAQSTHAPHAARSGDLVRPAKL